MTGQSWFRAVGWRHIVAIGAIIFALIPILFVLSAAFNPLGTLSSTLAHPDPVRAGQLHQPVQHHRVPALVLQLDPDLGACRRSCAVSLATFAAYAFSRYRFSGRRPGLLFLLIVQMFPAFLAIVVIYLMFTRVTELYPLHWLQHARGA